jgi:hypothetical protein
MDILSGVSCEKKDISKAHHDFEEILVAASRRAQSSLALFSMNFYPDRKITPLVTLTSPSDYPLPTQLHAKETYCIHAGFHNAWLAFNFWQMPFHEFRCRIHCPRDVYLIT